MANFFTKLFSKTSGKKFYTAYDAVYASSYAHRNISPNKALEYYNSIAPLFTAVHSVAGEVGSLDLKVLDTKKLEFTSQHPLLDLLKFPNADCTQYEFMVQLATFLKTTGNAFVMATGPVNRAPVELYAINPTSIQMNVSTSGVLESMSIVNQQKREQVFYLNEVDGRYRYYDGDSELWQVKTFSSKYGLGDPWGHSELNSITLELEQYYEASIHNLSLLKRGARPSGAIKVDEHLSDDQFQRLQQQLEGFYSGSKNAGRAMILEGGDFVEMSQSNKDMDFAALKKSITETIYNALRIPLPLVSAEYSSYNNMETAKLNFYDNCVLPLTKRLLEELTVFLMPRYDRTGTLELGYDDSEIEALEPRRNAELLKLKDSGVLTINELRAQLGYEPINGGSELYVPANLMPIGVDTTADLVKKVDGLLYANELKGCSHK